jgi:hypothetical protein
LSKSLDLTGKKFGRLKVVSRGKDFVGTNGRITRGWNCQCDCGNQILVRQNALTGGNTKSCGCLSRDIHSTQKGLSKSRLYNIWDGMKKRCYSKNNRAYSAYGGRGIQICDEWLGKEGFLNFRKWALNNGYAENLSIDRKNVDGNYAPDNCRWVDDNVQLNNTRRNHYIEFEGEKLTLAQWEKRTGIKQATIRSRLKKGMTVGDALTKRMT